MCVAFGRRLRELRRQRRLSEKQPAHLTGLQRTYVGGVERGERNPSTTIIARLGEALGVAPAGLFEPPESTQ